VLADLYTDHPERFDTDGKVGLAAEGFAQGSSSNPGIPPPSPAEVVAYWLPVGRNAGRIVLQFAGVTSIDAAETLAGKEVVIPAGERLPLTDGSVYVSDLVGATVFDSDVPVGEIAEVLFPTTPDGTRRLEEAVPLLSVTSPGGDEILIPFASAFLIEVDLHRRRIRMQLPGGLLEINQGRPHPSGDQPSDTPAKS
jgi:16S rRNA processing protein RimM